MEPQRSQTEPPELARDQAPHASSEDHTEAAKDDQPSSVPAQPFRDAPNTHYPSPLSRAKKRVPDWRTSHVEWKNKWSDTRWQDGRVLVVDYLRNEHLKRGQAKIAAQEFHDERGLRGFYASRDRCKQAALRIIHVQNAPWATRFLLFKFNIIPKDDLVGTDFGRWLRFEKPEWRAGRPLLKGKTWRVQRDPWRKIERTAFGVDYLQPYDVRGAERLAEMGNEELRSSERKLAEINCYDENDEATYGYDLFVQRLSVYIQHSNPDAEPPMDVQNPYLNRWGVEERKRGFVSNGNMKPQMHELPPIENLDNGSTIILFENSHSGSQNDTLVQARNQVESRWRQLTFYLDRDDIDDDQTLAQASMNVVLEDIFKTLSINWDNFFNITENHVAILEDKIYDSPADETRAPELWTNQSLWLKVEKLASIHKGIAREMVNHLREFSDDADTEHKWLEGVSEDFDKIGSLVEEDLVKPTATLNDLMYKSVEIRDSRQSLQLNNSLWLLSWITFIFLPLTFIGTVFGMNVDTFTGHPSIKWYFISAVVLMLVVLISFWSMRRLLNMRQQTPYQRGVYEHLYRDLAVSRPQLWSRSGPRAASVVPIGFWSKMRWHLLTVWFDPRKTIRARASDPDEDAGGSGLGMWARLQRTLARRWLNTINAHTVDPTSALEMGPTGQGSGNDGGETHVEGELLAYSDPTVVVESEAKPTGEAKMQYPQQLMPQHAGQQTESPTGSRRGSNAESSGRNSGMMVEERDVPPKSPESAGLWRQWPELRRQSDYVDTFGVGSHYQ